MHNGIITATGNKMQGVNYSCSHFVIRVRIPFVCHFVTLKNMNPPRQEGHVYKTTIKIVKGGEETDTASFPPIWESFTFNHAQ
jgi:hypothetical protein